MSALAEPRQQAKRPYNRVRTGIRDGRIVLLKACPRCGHDGICSEGPESDFYPRERGRKGAWHTYCKPCDVAYREERKEKINAGRRARHAQRMKTDPDYRRKHNEASRRSNAKWLTRPGSREKANRSSRNYRQRIVRQQPKKVLELQRMDYALRRERMGKPVRPRPGRDVDSAARLAPGQFCRWLAAYERMRCLGPTELAQELGLEDRTIRRIRAGAHGTVNVNVVSRALTNAKCVVLLDGRVIVTLNDLYGEDLTLQRKRRKSTTESEAVE